MKKLLFLTSFLCLEAIAQDQYAPKVIPPSPTAASLGKYGDIPVSYYTGQISNSILLYSIQDQDITIPISLSYHHGGIRVEEEASWVGLGFSLNAGGAITRTIRGRDDFMPTYGYAFNPPVSDYLPNPLSNTTFVNKTTSYSNPELDTEPDLFYYNIGGKSGKFILENNTSSTPFPIKGILLDQSDIKIRCISRIGSSLYQYQYTWEIIDENGIKYTFSEQEINTTASKAGYSATTADTDTNPALEYSFNKSHNITSWFLTSIYSPQSGTSITFNYNRAGKYYSVSRLSTNQVYAESGTELSPNPSDPNCTTQYTLTNSDLTDYTSISANFSRNSYLESITFSNGKVTFGITDREDIQRYENNSTTLPYSGILADYGAIDDYSQTTVTNTILNPQKLSFIEVKDASNNLIKKWGFTYSYFNESVISSLTPPLNISQNLLKYNNLRLRLDALYEIGKNGTSVLPSYKFVYVGDVLNSSNEVAVPVILPAKTSRAKDYWGYYNGKVSNNSSPNIIPKLAYPKMAASKIGAGDYQFNVIGFGNTFSDGIDRTTDTDLKQYGTLRKVTYPTGGNSQFVYESNVAKDATNEVITNLYEATLSNSSSSFLVTNNDTYAEITFELSCSGWPYTCQDPQNSSSTGVTEWYGRLTNGGTTVYERFFIDWLNKNCPTPNPVSTCTYKYVVQVKLTPGNYTLSVQRPSSLSHFATPRMSVRTYYFTTNNDDKPIAGLRVKEIITNDGKGVAKTQNFEYTLTNGNSSGKQMKIPVLYSYGYPDILQVLEASGQAINYPCKNLWWGIKIPSNSLTPLGTSASGTHVGYSRVLVTDGNGVTEYNYNNYEESPSSMLFPDLPSEYNGKNGMLIKESYYNNSGSKVREVLYSAPVSKANVSNQYKGMRYYIGNQLFPGGTSSVKVTKQVYNIPSNFWYSSEKIENIYDVSDNSYVSTTYLTEYNSNSHLQVTSSKISRSKNNFQEQLFKYPHEMVQQGITTPYQEMVDNNIITPVIEKITLVGSQTQIVEKIFYSKYYSFFKPTSIEVTENGGPAVNKILFNSYDSNGNLISYTEQGGITSSFSYYNSTGKKNLVATKTINNQTTSFDYYPLIGLKNVTDPNGKTTTYEYDIFNRLVRIKDYQNRLLKEFCYQYGSLPIDCALGTFSGVIPYPNRQLSTDFPGSIEFSNDLSDDFH